MGRGKPKHVTNFGTKDMHIAFLKADKSTIDGKLHVLKKNSGSVGEISYPKSTNWHYLYVRVKEKSPIQVLTGDNKAYAEFHFFNPRAGKTEDGEWYDVHLYKYRSHSSRGLVLEMPDDIEVDDPPPAPTVP